eukprot:EC716431.1.p1 GENE.EC716431.1~~EC716431.1.p1  ORF type:complete len:172 (+),score=32.61 EC716431.1:17-532(+)
MSLKTILNILLLDSEGRRIVAKYYYDKPVAAQKPYEKKLFEKTSKAAARDEAEIIMFDGMVSVYRTSADVTLYVSGGQDENELILSEVLNSLYTCLQELRNGSFDQKSLMENMDSVFLAIDEHVDNGIVMDVDGAEIAGRVSMRGDDFGEQTLTQAITAARDTLMGALQKL